MEVSVSLYSLAKDQSKSEMMLSWTLCYGRVKKSFLPSRSAPHKIGKTLFASMIFFLHQKNRVFCI